MTYTKEQKKAYFASLREKWNACKIASENDADAKAKWQAINEQAGGKLSYSGFYFTYIDMKHQGLEGLPYIDAKTFQGWKQAGFIVKKGEKSTLSGISWVLTGDKDNTTTGNDNETSDGYLYPKEYHLFHRNQVEAL